jgi:uncharacterized protein (TIGR02231 family)
VRVDVAPRLDPLAYLSAEFTWTGDLHLFPGTVTLASDGVSVGKATIPFVAKGDTQSIAFGADDLVRVVRQAERVEETEAGIINMTRTRTSDTKATVTNRHAGPVDVRVTDRIPFSEEADVKVERKAVVPEPDSVGEREDQGVLTWNRRLGPGEALSVQVSYGVTWPKSRQLNVVGR